MNRQEFVEQMTVYERGIHALQATKGKDYAGDDDVLLNFKRNAAALDLTPEQIWAVYAGKHWDAIQTYCKSGKVSSEGIEGRLLDLITYCYLQLAMVHERYRREEGEK